MISTKLNTKNIKIMALISVMLLSIACSNSTTPDEEESGIQYSLSETANENRAGVQAIVSFDTSTSEFTGTLKNITSKTIIKVRLEIHLSNQTELGPTQEFDLAPNEQKVVSLNASGESFSWWTMHAESGSGGSEGGGGGQ